MKTRLLIPILLIFGVAYAIAQQSTSTSSSSSKQGSTSGSATASGSASGSSSTRGSASGSQSGSGGASVSFVKPTHAIIWVPGDKWVEDAGIADQPMFFEHSQYLNSLARLGKLVMSGPWRDDPGGLTLIHVRTDEEAQAIADNSPMVKNGVLSAEVKAWNVTIVGMAPPVVK